MAIWVCFSTDQGRYILVISSFCLLWIELPCTFVYRFQYKPKFSSLWNGSRGDQLLGGMVINISFLKKLPNCFFIVAARFNQPGLKGTHVFTRNQCLRGIRIKLKLNSESSFLSSFSQPDSLLSPSCPSVTFYFQFFFSSFLPSFFPSFPPPLFSFLPSYVCMELW